MKDFYKGKKVFVTGANGYIGNRLVLALRNLGATVYEEFGGLRDTAEFHWFDYLKNMDLCFHLAARTSTQEANRYPEDNLMTNVRSFIRMMVAIRTDDLPVKVIFAGTATQVGITHGLVDESFQDRPATIYDIHKLINEKYLEYFTDNGVTLRLTNVYGPGKLAKQADRGIINKLVSRAVKGEPVSICPTLIRDFLYIDDAVRAFLMAGAKVSRGHYIVGSGIGTSLPSVVHLIMEEVKRQMGFEPAFGPLYEGKLLPIDKRICIADSALFTGETGWTAQIELSEGIRRTVEYFKAEL